MSRGSERRRDPRLPYANKVILTDGNRSLVAHAANLSRGGLFLKTMAPLPIDTIANTLFYLPTEKKTLCLEAKIVHVVFDPLGDSENGMGLQFENLSDKHRTLLSTHFLSEQSTYLELRELLNAPRPNLSQVTACLRQMRHLEELDLLALRYRVERICTLFTARPQLGAVA